MPTLMEELPALAGTVIGAGVLIGLTSVFLGKAEMKPIHADLDKPLYAKAHSILSGVV
jgi:hypothetical protein